MWTLIVLAAAALLWLLKLTVGTEDIDAAMFSPDLLARVTLGLSVLASVLLLQRLLGHALRRRQGAGANATSDLLHAVMRITLYVGATLLYLGGGLGLDIRSVLATSAVLTVIVGLALQPTLGHLFAGVSIEIERPLRVGDFVRRDEMEGQVISLSWRSVALKTIRGSKLIIPNSDFNSRLIEVISAERPFRHSVNFNLASNLPPGQVIRVAMEVLCSGLPDICTTPSPSVFLLGTDAATGTLRYSAQLSTLEFLNRTRVVSGFLERLWYALSRDGLTTEAWWPTHALRVSTAATPTASDNPGERHLSRALFRRDQERPDGNARDRSMATRWPRPTRALSGATTARVELDSRLQDALLACAQTLRYGPSERCDSRMVALVQHGSLMENRALDAQRSHATIAELVSQVERPVSSFTSSDSSAAPRLSPAIGLDLLRKATLTLGPLAHDICRRVATLTADPHIAYHAVAAFIPEPRQRAAFLNHAPTQPNRSLAPGDWLGWAHALDLEADIPVCRVSEACTLLIWSPAVLREALQGASTAELDTLAAVLRDGAPGCAGLRVPQLTAWLHSGSATRLADAAPTPSHASA